MVIRLILSAKADLDSTSSFCTGHSVGGRFRNPVTSHHKELRSKVGPYIPLDGKLAGFLYQGNKTNHSVVNHLKCLTRDGERTVSIPYHSLSNKEQRQNLPSTMY